MTLSRIFMIIVAKVSIRIPVIRYITNLDVQNKTHIENLKRQLNQGNVPFFSVIVFYGDCRFKDISSIPDGVFLIKSYQVLEVVKTIKETNNPAMYRSKVEVVRVLREAVYNGENISIQKQHVKNINDMLSKRRRFY